MYCEYSEETENFALLQNTVSYERFQGMVNQEFPTQYDCSGAHFYWAPGLFQRHLGEHPFR